MEERNPLIYFLKIAQDNGCGLCNQLYSLTGCIDHSNFYKNYNVIVIDKFLREIETESYCPISDIIDLQKFNFFLQKYNVYLIDSYYLQLEIVSIKLHDGIDVTEKIITKRNPSYFKYNCLDIPDCDVTSNLIIRYKLNKDSPIFTKMFKKGTRACIDFSLMNNPNTFAKSPQLYLGGSQQRDVFFNILTNIPFQSKFVSHAYGILENIINEHNSSSKLNVIHLRLEEDAIRVESNNARISPGIFKTTMEEKFIQMIKKYIDKNILTIILSPNFDNKVIEFLKINNYKFIRTEKTFLREENALVDLLIGTYCTDTFIGVYESSFSYTLLHKIMLQIKPKGFKGYLFEMHRPNIDDQIFNL